MRKISNSYWLQINNRRVKWQDDPEVSWPPLCFCQPTYSKYKRNFSHSSFLFEKPWILFTARRQAFLTRGFCVLICSLSKAEVIFPYNQQSSYPPFPNQGSADHRQWFRRSSSGVPQIIVRGSADHRQGFRNKLWNKWINTNFKIRQEFQLSSEICLKRFAV